MSLTFDAVEWNVDQPVTLAAALVPTTQGEAPSGAAPGCRPE